MILWILTSPLMLIAFLCGILAYALSSTYQYTLHLWLAFEREKRLSIEIHKKNLESLLTLQRCWRGGYC